MQTIAETPAIAQKILGPKSDAPSARLKQNMKTQAASTRRTLFSPAASVAHIAASAPAAMTTVIAKIASASAIEWKRRGCDENTAARSATSAVQSRISSS